MLKKNQKCRKVEMKKSRNIEKQKCRKVKKLKSRTIEIWKFRNESNEQCRNEGI